MTCWAGSVPTKGLVSNTKDGLGGNLPQLSRVKVGVFEGEIKKYCAVALP